jgi:hypothetical protein
VVPGQRLALGTEALLDRQRIALVAVGPDELVADAVVAVRVEVRCVKVVTAPTVLVDVTQIT